MKIEIKWQAFGDKPEIWRFTSKVEIEVPKEYVQFITDERICAEIYHQTNTYQGSIWDIIKPKMSETRTHTAISIGDEIIVDGRAYTVADFGFVKTEDAEIRKVGEVIFSVQEKEKV